MSRNLISTAGVRAAGRKKKRQLRRGAARATLETRASVKNELIMSSASGRRGDNAAAIYQLAVFLPAHVIIILKFTGLCENKGARDSPTAASSHSTSLNILRASMGGPLIENAPWLGAAAAPPPPLPPGGAQVASRPARLWPLRRRMISAPLVGWRREQEEKEPPPCPTG